MSADPPRGGRVIISSTRAANGTYADETGPVIVDWLNRHGIDTPPPMVVPDGVAPVADALRDAIESDAAVILTSGGTGLSPDDRTPEATIGFIDREIPGIVAEIRRRGVAAGIPTAILTRGHAGVAGRSVVVNLPGSAGGVRDGLAVLEDILSHLLRQVAGDTSRPTGHGRAHD